MGWSDCGTDDLGRPIGYAHEGVCDWPGCDNLLTRGLANACGGMHGENEESCAGYFCDRHLVLPDREGAPFVCPACCVGNDRYGEGDWPDRETLIREAQEQT